MARKQNILKIEERPKHENIEEINSDEIIHNKVEPFGDKTFQKQSNFNQSGKTNQRLTGKDSKALQQIQH